MIQRTAVGITRIKTHNANSYSLYLSVRAQGGHSTSAKVRAKKGPTYMARAIRTYDPFYKQGPGTVFHMYYVKPLHLLAHDPEEKYFIKQVRIRRGILEGQSATLGYWFAIQEPEVKQ